MKLNPAQQVRLWFMAGLAVLGIIVAASGMSATSIFGVVPSWVQTCLIWEFLILLAECALGGVSFYRFMNPLSPQRAGEQPQPQETGHHQGSYQ
jgi:hypothetical protein